MGCECKNNHCSAKCKKQHGMSCEIDSDCKEQNNYTIKEYKDIIYKKQYKINYSNINQQGGSDEFEQIKKKVDKWDETKLSDHPRAKDVFVDLVFELGEPYILVNKKGGIAIWNNAQLKDGIHNEIILRDEAIKHCVPANHYDFLTSYIKIYIPPKKIIDVLSVSGSVTYDGLKKLLSARCGSLEANYATFRTCLKILDDENEDYSKNIKGKNNNDKENKEYIKAALIKNHKQYSKELEEPFYPLAFPKGCP
jgi:hypothetical protein